jgi:hypothetical protein
VAIRIVGAVIGGDQAERECERGRVVAVRGEEGRSSYRSNANGRERSGHNDAGAFRQHAERFQRLLCSPRGEERLGLVCRKKVVVHCPASDERRDLHRLDPAALGTLDQGVIIQRVQQSRDVPGSEAARSRELAHPRRAGDTSIRVRIKRPALDPRTRAFPRVAGTGLRAAPTVCT